MAKHGVHPVPVMTITAPRGSMTLLDVAGLIKSYSWETDRDVDIEVDELKNQQVEAVHCFMEQHRGER
jgi:hypothetical protein